MTGLPAVIPDINAFYVSELLQLAHLVFVLICRQVRLYLASKSSRWEVGSVLHATSE